MKTVYLILLFIQPVLPVFAQTDRAGVDRELKPYNISSRFNPLKRNLGFAEYKVYKFRRNIRSWLSSGKFNIGDPELKIGRVPLYKKFKTRRIDIFSFALKTDSGIVSRTRCKAVLRKNETFSVFRLKDPSLMKIKNVDCLEARIRTGGKTAPVWHMTATNLNGSLDAEEEGTIKCGDKEIRFTKTNRMLLDEPVEGNEMEDLFTVPHIVYLFTYNDDTIAAVSSGEKNKTFWCRDDVDSTIKTVVASAASVLCLRTHLYY